MKPRATKIPAVTRKNGPRNSSGLDLAYANGFAWSFLSQKLFEDFLVTLVTREVE